MSQVIPYTYALVRAIGYSFKHRKGLRRMTEIAYHTGHLTKKQYRHDMMILYGVSFVVYDFIFAVVLSVINIKFFTI